MDGEAMASFQPPNRLTSLQRQLLEAFFERESRMFLTGGGALAGFYFGHRDTEDLDLFTAQPLDLVDVTRTLEAAASACGARLEPITTYPEFRRSVAIRGDDRCVVDLVIDRAPMLDREKPLFGSIRVDSLREIADRKSVV